MNEVQWQKLLSVIDGDVFDPIPVGFIIDSPWLPKWAGMSILDYYTSESKWFDANMKAVETFPDIMFLPGFWSEYGMCTAPSAFGAKCIFHDNEFPFAEPVLDMDGSFGNIKKPNPRTDGLAPLVLRRLELCRSRIEDTDHSIRFAVARGPLNIAGFLMGNTEFLMSMKTDPDQTHALLDTITGFLVEWLQLQKSAIPTIDGILLLDDVVGFLGKGDFESFVYPYLKKAFHAFDSSVRFFHNDAAGLVGAPYLADIGVNMFNFSCDHSIVEMRSLVGDNVTLVGNIPPRDVMAQGSPDDVETSVKSLLESLTDRHRLILSCGGGMPPEVSSANIQAFLAAAK